jgi:hypothetical protein
VGDGVTRLKDAFLEADRMLHYLVIFVGAGYFLPVRRKKLDLAANHFLAVSRSTLKARLDNAVKPKTFIGVRDIDP